MAWTFRSLSAPIFFTVLNSDKNYENIDLFFKNPVILLKFIDTNL